MNPRQLLRTIESLGGKAEEGELCGLVDASVRLGVVDQLRGLEADGLIACETSIAWALTDAGRRELGSPA